MNTTTYFSNPTASYIQNSQPHSQQHIQETRLINPTPYHLEEQQRRLRQGNDGASRTPNNSFNNSTINPSILSTAPGQYPFVAAGHIKHESGSIDVSTEFEFDQPTTLCSPTMSSSPIGSPINRNNIHSGLGVDDDNMCHSYKPMGTLSHMDNASQYGESPGNTSIYSQGHEMAEYDQGDICMSAPNMFAFESKQRIVRQPQNNFAQSLPAEWLNTLSNSLPQGAHLPYHPDVDIPSVYQPFMDPEETADTAQKQAILCEKRRRRRESHNAVERRRRDNINEKIQEISTLIPDMYNDSSNKPNKGVILRKAVEYIKHLQQMVGEQRALNVMLENRVRDMKSGIPIENSSDLNASSQSSGLGASPQTSSLGSNNNNISS